MKMCVVKSQFSFQHNESLMWALTGGFTKYSVLTSVPRAECWTKYVHVQSSYSPSAKLVYLQK